MSRRPDDGADESPPDDVPLIGCLLAPGGFLMLGKVETLMGPVRTLFETVDQRQRIFRRAVLS